MSKFDLRSQLDGPKWAPVEGRLRSQSVAPTTAAPRKPAAHVSPSWSQPGLSGTAKKLFSQRSTRPERSSRHTSYERSESG